MRSYSSITTIIMHHPDRPVDCLVRALDSLAASTTMDLVVEVVVQGRSRDGSLPELPPVESFPFELSYQMNASNIGNSLPLAQSAAKCRTGIWSKLDDDTVLPDKGWDLLLKVLEEEEQYTDEPFVFDIGAVAFGHHDSIPRLIKVSEGYLYRVPGSFVKRDGDGVSWEVADFGSNGATIYLPEVFSRGCGFDPTHFVVSEHIDMALQMSREGFHVIQVTEPLAPHNKNECTPAAYHGIRLSPKRIVEGYEKLRSKWGLCDVALHNNAHGRFPPGTKKIFVAGGPRQTEGIPSCRDQ